MWNWHSLTEGTQNNLSRSPAQLCQTTSRTAAVWNQLRCPSDSLQAAAVRDTVWLHMVWWWKCLPSNHHSTRRTIGFMHQLMTRSDTSTLAICYACWLWCPLPCHKWVWLKWYLSPTGEGERPVLLRCLAVSADASSNRTCHRTLFLHKTIMLLTVKLVVFCVL